MKGADQCPKCGSRKWGDGEQSVTGFYARTLRVCANCATAWEPFAASELLDTDDRYSSFTEPCNNCAFRPGSNEQKDPAKWKELIASLSINDSGYPSGRFYCHKGVALDLHHKTPTESGFCFPTKTVTVELAGETITKEVPDDKKLRLCRGFLKMWATQQDKIRATALEVVAERRAKGARDAES